MQVRAATTPAPAIFVISAIAQYLGASIAVHLFDEVVPSTVAWLRVAVAAICLVIWRRPKLRTWTRRQVSVAVLFGIVTLGMNVVFYEAIARLPLGTAVAMEFIGPVSIAALGSRSVRDFLGLMLAVCGIILLADVRWEGHAIGVLFALAAGALWAGYIVLGKTVADGSGGIDGLAVGLCGASLLSSPMVLTTGPVWHSPYLLLFAVAVGVLSSALPYALDQVVLARMGRGGFALLLAILPATAALVGVVVLRQFPTPVEAAGIALVVVAVWVSQSRWRGTPPSARAGNAD